MGSFQKSVSNSRIGTRLALKVREQCNSIIGLRCQSGINPEDNGEAWLAERIAPHAEVVVDIGANLGEWTSMFARNMTRPGQAILFEPNPEAAARLRQMSLPNTTLSIDIREKAVSDSAGSAKFFAEPNYGETSSLAPGHSNSQARTITVPVVTLDGEMAALGLDRIDMLKIDAEGYDLRVLMGARQLLEKRRVGAIQFEYNAPWAAAGSTLVFAFQLLEEAGYRVFLLKQDGAFRFNALLLKDYFRYSNFIALRPDIADIVLKDITLEDVL